MKIYDKKLPIIIIFLCIIICISIYFFTKDKSDDFSLSNNLYITNSTEETQPEEKEIIIHIDGEIINPGIVLLPSGSRISDAITASGGITAQADLSKINLAYELSDGQKIYVPSVLDEDEIPYIQNDAGTNVVIPDISSNSSLVNINTATQSELESLPGIGASTASKIINYRKENGKFKQIEDIMNVNGIGESKFNNIKNYICI